MFLIKIISNPLLTIYIECEGSLGCSISADPGPQYPIYIIYIYFIKYLPINIIIKENNEKEPLFYYIHILSVTVLLV